MSVRARAVRYAWMQSQRVTCFRVFGCEGGEQKQKPIYTFFFPTSLLPLGCRPRPVDPPPARFQPSATGHMNEVNFRLRLPRPLVPLIFRKRVSSTVCKLCILVPLPNLLEEVKKRRENATFKMGI